MTKKSDLKIVGGTKELGDEELRQWFEKFLVTHPHLTTEKLSRSDHIGYGKTALDAYRAGTYFTSRQYGGHGVNPKNSRIEEKIRAYRDRVEGSVKNGYNTEFRETILWKQFQYLCKTAIQEKVIVIGYGKPGVGKSRALEHYKTEKMETMPIEIFCSRNITPKYFAQKIASEIGVNPRHPLAELEDLIAKKLKSRSSRLLFVDQANYLDEKSLGTICYIWEKAQIPIVLLGTMELFNLFMQSNLTEDVRAQLTSRVAWHCPFVDLHIKEVKSIVTHFLGKKATPAVIEQIFNITGANHRHLNMVLPRVLGIVEKNKDVLDDDGEVIESLISEAGRKLLIA